MTRPCIARWFGVIAWLWALSPIVSPALGQIDADRFRDDLAHLAQSTSRMIGSPGYYAAGNYLEQQIAALPNVELQKHEFPVMVPVTQSATLDLGGSRVEPVYPFWPAKVRVSATPKGGITGNLVYAGECRFAQIKPASLYGQIAVIEASAGSRWTEPFYAGAAAEIVLGSDQTDWTDLKDHDVRIPVDFPRFYVPPGPLADELRAGRLLNGTIKASATWQRKLATNFYALVRPAKSPGGADGAKASSSAALMFSVPLDSTSLVPDLSPGAGQAVQTAAGLALLRDLSKHPWDRSVVVFFSGADGIQFLGTRNMFMALATPPVTWRDELADLDLQLQTVQSELARAREIQQQPQKLSVSADRDLCNAIAQIIDTDLATEQDELFRLRAASAPDQTPENRARRLRLEDRQVFLQRIKFAFQQQPVLLADAKYAGYAQDYVSRMIARLGGNPGTEGLFQQYASRKSQLQRRIDLYHWLANAEGRTPEPTARQTDSRLIELLVGLDLSDRGARAGPMFYGYFQQATGIAQIQLYNDWFAKLQRDFDDHVPAAQWWGKVRQSIDLEPLNQIRGPTSYLAAPLPVASELAQVWGTPGLSMITLDDLRLRRDTPTDTLAHLNVNAILPQLAAVRELFSRAWNDPKFRGPAELKRLDVSIAGQVVSSSPDKPVPDLPRDGFLATYYYIISSGAAQKIPSLGMMPWVLGIRRDEVQDCDARGNYRFEGLPRLRSDRLEGPNRAQNDMQVLAVNVYRIDPQTGAITATTDLGRQSGDITWAADIKQDVPPLRSLVFDCEEFSLLGLRDPRFLQTLGEVLPLDARRDAEPQQYGMWLDAGMLAGFVEPGTRADLLLRFGQIGNRLILVNVPAHGPAAEEDGTGYSPGQLSRLGPVALATTGDFYRLDDGRLDAYRRAGVSSSLIDRLHQDAGQRLTAARQSLARDDGVGLARDATAAWADEARVYEAAQDMARDVVRAAIFLLILCVPFSFCMERLLIATPNVYKQITGVSAIFVFMTLLLWTFHPAFKISASPLIIILAFAIISMSCLVIWVIFGKFDAELKRIRSGRRSPEGTSFASASVVTSAVLLGIANMRKRKFRTTLTSVTIVLITFAVLWFTSTSRYLGTTTLNTGVATPHPGLMLRQRGFRPMPDTAADQLQAVLADSDLAIGRPRVVERWWAVSSVDPKEQYDLVTAPTPAPTPVTAPVTAPTAAAATAQLPREIGVTAVLGLSPGESDLSCIADVIGPANFSRLENGEQNIIYIGNSVADDLNVSEGDWLRLGGIDVQIAGVFDTASFDEKVTMLSGESLAPLRFSTGELDAGGQQLDDNTSQALELDGNSPAAEVQSVYEHLSSTDFVIVPAALCRKLPKSTLRTLEFRLQNEAQVEKTAQALSRRFALATYAGYDDGVRMVAAGSLASVSGLGEVFVPLLIAGLIIFNTMMGSIAERRNEIHIYTSLGLAPMHVGVLFLAEAMTYGLVGSVFGYIMGQAMGTAMLKFGWLGTITLNYSGTSAVLTMGLILAVVVLSAIVPARVASKIAAPSIDRTWKVPDPVDGQILAELPFTINRTAADGVLAYLAEYFQAHREGSIGKFAAGPVEPVTQSDPATGATSHGLKTTVWLTPYDVGVRQLVTLLIHPGSQPDIYEVQVALVRQSGDDGSWYRMNKTFLTDLRRQFLQWRSLSPNQMLEYVEQSKQLFDRAT